jgi:pimeloyl-ACP methyl ester carboxylesterase
MRRFARRWLLLCALLFATALTGGACALLVVGDRLSQPQQRSVGPPPAGLPVASVSLEHPNRPPTSGWFIPGEAGAPGVLLLHSIRSDRREMLGRARFLHAAGYAVLLVDLQAHGETTGDRITFDRSEAADAAVALAYLRQRVGGQPVGVLGVSLGGAATLLGRALRLLSQSRHASERKSAIQCCTIL